MNLPGLASKVGLTGISAPIGQSDLNGTMRFGSSSLAIRRELIRLAKRHCIDRKDSVRPEAVSAPTRSDWVSSLA
jgi:hypothetical protein